MAITVRLSLKPKPRFGRNEQGFYAQVSFVVTGVDWPTETLSDIFTALPHYGQTMKEVLEARWVPQEFEYLTVREVAPTQPDLSKHDTWIAEVTFGPRSGTTEPDKQYVRWSGGTITRRVEVDLWGYAIGSRNWVQASDGKPLHPNAMKRRRMGQASLTNEHAELGADVHMPTMEFEIQVPLLNSDWNQASMEVTTIARGRVNNSNFTFVDEWNTPFYMAPYWCLLRDVLVQPDSRATFGHMMVYRFMLAALDLPSNPTAYWNTGPLGDYTTEPDPPIPDPLPVGYGAFVAFKPMEPGDPPVYAPDTGEVPQPRDIRIFQAHLGYDFNTLPGIIG